METTMKKAYDLHAEHQEWTGKMNFYKDELLVIQKRLDEIASKNTDKAVLASVESYQNKLKIQRNEIDVLLHDIKDHENYIENKVGDNPAADHKSLHDHANERERVEQFEKLFAELRKEFNAFLSKHM
jgi:hypothetical protein